jgi:hypothetical protein
MSQDINAIRQELERRRGILILLSRNHSFPMDIVERSRIQSILEHWEVPLRPTDIPTLTKQFCVSTFSYAPLRRYLKGQIGVLPMRDTIALALSNAFNNDDFLNDSNWLPESLYNLAQKIQETNQYDLTSRQFKPRILAVLLTGSLKLRRELKDGIEAFYARVSEVTVPLEMWNLVNEFSSSIDQVGPALICDFFKEIGFNRYVKVDHHFRKEFPQLVNTMRSCGQNPKQSFILSQEIADAVGITPFHLDSILYLWGRYGGSQARR